jgi:hypothetical protein
MIEQRMPRATMLIEFAPIVFGTAGLLAVLLFFAVEEQ